jgi:hypothetical protein
MAIYCALLFTSINIPLCAHNIEDYPAVRLNNLSRSLLSFSRCKVLILIDPSKSVPYPI